MCELLAGMGTRNQPGLQIGGFVRSSVRNGLVAAMVVILGGACADAAAPLVGRQWTSAEGDIVDSEVVNAIRGPDHCGWQSSIWLHLGWPVGRPAENASQMRQYIRDPRDAVGLESGMDIDTELPDGATDTGYRNGNVELWLGPAGGDEAIFLVFSDHTERWPRSPEIIACA